MMRRAIIIILIVLSGCRLHNEEKPKMQSESVKMHCVGRHVVSVPVSFDISNVTTGIFKMEGANAQDPEIDIMVQSDITTRTKFEGAVQQRRDELNRSESKTVDVLKEDKILPDGSVLFRVQEIDDAYFSEMYFLRGTSLVKIRLESYGDSYLDAEERLRKLSVGIVERNPRTIVENGGFCLGSVLINSNLSQEVASFTFRNASGLVFMMDLDTFSHDESVSLFNRMSRDSSVLRDLQIRTQVLRARERTVAGMSADEWLGVAYPGNAEDERSLKFMLETKRKNPGKTAPVITLSLDSAQPLKDGTVTTTKIVNAEALRLWDQIVDSIKIAGGYDA